MGQGPTLLPTKTSGLCNQLFGRSPGFLRTGSQVALTFDSVRLSRFTFDAMILSSVSLLLIVFVHRARTSDSVCCFPWIARSQRRTQIKYADSEIKIWSSRVGPLLWGLLRRPSSRCRIVWGVAIRPHPSTVPSVISGQGMCVWGQWLLAISQVMERVVPGQFIRMCSIDSSAWFASHAEQNCRRSNPDMLVQKGPIFCVPCIALKRNWRILIRIAGFFSPLHIASFVSRSPVYLSKASLVSWVLAFVARRSSGWSLACMAL
jgi:hypothetical protein